MTEDRRHRRIRFVNLRAHIPRLLRVVAFVALAASLIVVIVSYYRLRNRTPFRMLSGRPTLSKEVVGVVEGYERRVTEGDRLRLLLRAARDVTYADGRHELENVYLEYYPEASAVPDKISARRALYDPTEEKIDFFGAVHVETHERLLVDAEQISYYQREERAKVPVAVSFARDNVRGRAGGAMIDAKARRLELHNGAELIIEARQSGKDQKPVIIRASRADFDQRNLTVVFAGGATAEQGRDSMSADTLVARLSEEKRVQRIEARGNALLRSLDEGHAAEVLAAQMEFVFDDEQRLERADAMRDVRARTLDADSEATLRAERAQLDFAAQGGRSLLRALSADGRPVITLAAPRSRAGDPRAANKRLTADSVHLFWRDSGRDLERAEAIGNAELVIEPAHPSPVAERKALYAPRFDCAFYETNNLAQQFTAVGGAKLVIAPLQPSAERVEKVITAQKMIALFARDTQDVERVEALGEARFDEGERHGRAENATYVASERTVRLRGAEPTVWDDRARVKAREIDTDLQREVSYARGDVATTYYSQAQTGGATPFAKMKSPVFITSNAAEFHHRDGLAIFTGNARAWQEDNFVRADRLTLRREERRMEAEGRVQSAFYRARRKVESGSSAIVPVFAIADRMTYFDADRLIRYEGHVDIRQGTDRLMSEVAEVYLSKEANEVERTVAQRNVILTQPGRRGIGDWAQYTASGEVVVLTGSPARVEDFEQGSTESRRLTVYLNDRRVVAEGGENGRPAGRVHSVHRVRRQK